MRSVAKLVKEEAVDDDPHRQRRLAAPAAALGRVRPGPHTSSPTSLGRGGRTLSSEPRGARSNPRGSAAPGICWAEEEEGAWGLGTHRRVLGRFPWSAPGHPTPSHTRPPLPLFVSLALSPSTPARRVSAALNFVR